MRLLILNKSGLLLPLSRIVEGKSGDRFTPLVNHISSRIYVPKNKNKNRSRTSTIAIAGARSKSKGQEQEHAQKNRQKETVSRYN